MSFGYKFCIGPAKTIMVFMVIMKLVAKVVAEHLLLYWLLGHRKNQCNDL